MKTNQSKNPNGGGNLTKVTRRKSFGKKLIATVLMVAMMASMGSVMANEEGVRKTIITDPNEMISFISNYESDPSVESPFEKHQSLLEQGYILESITVETEPQQARAGATHIASTSISKYRQPTKNNKEYVNKVWQAINAAGNNPAVVLIGDNLKLKIIPHVIGLTRAIFNSYGGRNYVQTISDSTLFIKIINVKDVAINKTYAVGWAERLNVAFSLVHAGWNDDGSVLHFSFSRNYDYYANNYDDDTFLKNKAINVYKNNPFGERYYKHHYIATERTL